MNKHAWTTTPRMLDDGTETPADDEELHEGTRFAMLYSLREVEGGFTVVAFDRFGRSVRGHALIDVRFATPGAAFEAIRQIERGAEELVKASPARGDGARGAGAEARSA